MRLLCTCESGRVWPPCAQFLGDPRTPRTWSLPPQPEPDMTRTHARGSGGSCSVRCRSQAQIRAIRFPVVQRGPMRLSQYFLPVLREVPSEAEIASHQLMLRAGMIRQASAGIYSWLPLGFRVLKKVEQIV